MSPIRSRVGAVVGLVVLALAGTGVATAVQPVNLASRADRTAMEPRVDYTGVIKGPDNANVRKARSLNAEEWGLVYNSETVHLLCKQAGEGATWYQLLGQGNKWIIGDKLERLTPGIPDCRGGQAGDNATIKGPDNANVRKGPSLNADKWGLVYDTERVSLRCKATAEGATWYQLAGQRDRWIIGSKLEGIATGIPVC